MANPLTAHRRGNLGRMLFRGYRSINMTLLEELKATGHQGLRLGHVGVLSNLDYAQGTRQVSLAERAGVTKQAVGPVVRELERLGYVSTHPDPTDHRAKLVSLTDTGRQVIEHAQPIIDRIENSIRANLGAAQYQQLQQLLLALLAGFEEGDAYPPR
jgi:DNA-binding MarR family transcriptional regulator